MIFFSLNSTKVKMADANRGKGARGNRNPVGGGPPARGNRNPVGGGPPARGNRNPVGGGPPARGNLNPVGGGPPARGNRNPVGGGPPARGNLNPVGGGPPARRNRHPVGGGPPAPARRAWDDVFIFQPGERMYDQLLHWVTTMLQQQHAAGLLRQQQAGQDVVYNQFAVGQIGNRLQRTEPRGSPQVHCEEQLIRMIQQPQDMFIIYTENFTCQMRVGTERRCNCFFQVSEQPGFPTYNPGPGCSKQS